jgi:GH18 family chitinase
MAHKASGSEGRMILSKRIKGHALLASLIHNTIEFKDAWVFDGVDIDWNNRLGQELAF